MRDFRKNPLNKSVNKFERKSSVLGKSLVVCLLMLVPLIQPSAAQADDPISLDISFGTGGIVTTPIEINAEANSVVMQSDGKIVVVGYSDTGTNNDFAVARYNEGGSLDESFGTGGDDGIDGVVKTNICEDCSNSIATSVVIQNVAGVQKIIVVGKTSRTGSGQDFVIVRYNPDGLLDTTFGATETPGIDILEIGSDNDIATSVVIQNVAGVQKIIVVGHTIFDVWVGEEIVGSSVDFVIVRYNEAGIFDRSNLVDLGSDEEAASVAIQNIAGEQKIIVAGTILNSEFGNDFVVIRLKEDLTFDTSFGDGGNVKTHITASEDGDVATSVAIQNIAGEQKIVVSGHAQKSELARVFAVVRYFENGLLDESFGTVDDDGIDGVVLTQIGIEAEANSVVVQSDGKIVVVGGTVYQPNPDVEVYDLDFAGANYNADGSLIGVLTTDIEVGSEESAYSVVLQSDGKIVVAGYTNNGVTSKFAVVRYSTIVSGGAAGSNDLTWVGAQSITCPAPNPWVNEQLGFSTNAKPVLITAENTVGKTITSGSYKALRSSGVVFDTVSKKVSTATETLPIYGCKDKLLSGKVNQPIQFIAGGYTLQSNAHGYINTADLKWHDTNGVTLYTNTAAFMHTIKFTQTGKYVVVLTEQPDTSRRLIPTYGVRSVRFVININ
jgi:uncharacterized delta-60 repeat protein